MTIAAAKINITIQGHFNAAYSPSEQIETHPHHQARHDAEMKTDRIGRRKVQVTKSPRLPMTTVRRT